MKRIFTIALIAMFAAGAIPALASPAPFITPPAPQFTEAERQAELARRRAAVEAKMVDNSVMVLLSAEPKLYTGDVDYVFRQENDLYYLTNLKQQDATLVIQKKAGKITETVYLPKRDPSQETWKGKMYSVEDAERISGIKRVLPAEEAQIAIDALKRRSDPAIQTVYLLLEGDTGEPDGQREFGREAALSKQLKAAPAGKGPRPRPLKVLNGRDIIDDLRMIKSRYEQKLLQHAVDISTEAHERAWMIAGNVSMEYELQAEVEYTFRRRNADFWGYPSIVGAGANGTTLHYEESQGPVRLGDLVLMDVGAEYDHLTADVTRTFPVNGKFSKEQADIYQIVYDAQEAVAKAAKPGASMMDIEFAADEVLKNGLLKLGLITPENPQYQLWYMHGVGHWLGMNVHDVGSRFTFEPGMTFTNEPGIYIRADALDYLPDTPENRAFKAKIRPAFEKYKNIGVRIEDDMIITPTGVEWMTKNLPRKMSDIEDFIAANKRSQQ
ncbi:MAG: aminopeptidase P N-terminal domain-containing protein [Acidobacteria bacterium]|nr:aminopeptidase P N-terminal domain-containing protein [Acidobacteriota bacterium]